MSGGKTLKQLFDGALKLHSVIEHSTAESIDAKKQEAVKECTTLFQDLWRAVDQAKVFSPNEEVEDMATGDIKFLTVLYYLGDLQERVVDTNRVNNLRNAVRCFQLFMRLCLDYAIIPEKEYELLTTPINPTDRAARVERLKKQKELQARLADLSEKKKLISRRISEAGCVAGGDLKDDQEFEFDAAERQYWLLAVEDKLRSASQQLQMSTRELEMLTSLSQEQKDQAVEEYQRQIEDSRGRPPDPSQLQRIEAAPEPMLVTQLSMDRERILKEVFMDRNPATMSDAEYCRQQMERMLPSDTPKDEKNPDESEDEEEAERARVKSSKWDDWKDDHARDGNMGSNIG
eukprot:TRINITY_DN20391_c0_g1_i3.p1 TRINITY_DN20391_c0_g1~~TRINITY_DN20391_c0_g1_i3.p1  ORF type:complete len:346 (+),score=156.80 TRINITY_DN20391_c0_g1_i3:105-1142(+)